MEKIKVLLKVLMLLLFTLSVANIVMADVNNEKEQVSHIVGPKPA